MAPFVCLEVEHDRFFLQVKFIILKMESCCSVKVLVGGDYDYDPKDRKCDSEIVRYCLAIRKSTVTGLYN